jgi:hypothetical protein
VLEVARNKIGLQVKGFENYMAKLDEVGGSQAMRRGVESALKASKAYVNPLIESSMNKLPAGGKYSTGDTKRSIDKSMDVEWQMQTASVKVGFDFSKSGTTSIYLMYGTPKMKPVSGLKSAIYGAKTKREIAEVQAEALDKVIKRIMEE